MRNRKRYSIKFLLLFTAIVAAVFAVLEFRPRPQITVAFQTSGSVSIDGELVDAKKLRSTIEQERAWRKLWLQKPEVIIILPQSILVEEDYLLDDPATKSIQELMNPTPRKHVIRAWDVADLLNKHNLSDLDDFVVGGVNREINTMATAR